MHELAISFSNFCKHTFNLNDTITYSYNSLPICVIDCVYSLRAKYNLVTVPIVQRYADKYLNGDTTNSNDTISAFIMHLEELDNISNFADILKNHQVSGGIPKEKICYQIAKYLSYLHIETIEDFHKFEDYEFIEKILYSVKGISNAGVNYLFMLAGDSNRCKVDTHIKKCIADFYGQTLSDNEIQELFKDTVSILNASYPELTVRTLDGIIWRKYQKS